MRARASAAVETLVAIFSETAYHADLDREAMLKVHRYFANFPETQSRYVAAVLHRPPDSHPPDPEA